MVSLHPVPLTATYDPAHGGRWTTLSGGGREWLWHRPDPARESVSPGAAFADAGSPCIDAGSPFVDAGGVEECLPTVRGIPDHGDVWSRPWRVAGPGTLVVERPAFVLTRRITDRAGVVVADYRLAAAPGHRFIWAAHALLDLSPAARLDAPAGTPTLLYPDTGPPARGQWPAPAGLPLDHLGPDDGTAVGAVLQECPRVVVTDGADRLTLELECAGQPRSTALWRNLCGWPAPAPYRSIGVEPMLGAVFDLAEAGPGEAAVVPAAGEVTWRLTVSAHRLPGGPAR